MLYKTKMALIKDRTVLQILSHLEQRFGGESFRIEDYWDADLCSIGLADNSGRYLLYLNTFGKPNGSFHAELEDKAKTDNTNKPIQVFGTLKIEGLEDIFRQYFIGEKS